MNSINILLILYSRKNMFDILTMSCGFYGGSAPVAPPPKSAPDLSNMHVAFSNLVFYLSIFFDQVAV